MVSTKRGCDRTNLSGALYLSKK